MADTAPARGGFRGGFGGSRGGDKGAPAVSVIICVKNLSIMVYSIFIKGRWRERSRPWQRTWR